MVVAEANEPVRHRTKKTRMLATLGFSLSGFGIPNC